MGWDQTLGLRVMDAAVRGLAIVDVTGQYERAPPQATLVKIFYSYNMFYNKHPQSCEGHSRLSTVLQAD